MKNLLLSLMCLFLLGCLRNSNDSDIPEIEFIAVSKNFLVQDPIGLNDSIFVSFSFKDGDGDLGEDQEIDLYVIDNRTGNFYDNNLSIPMLPEQGAGNGITGEAIFKLFSTCCIFPDGIPNCETPPNYPDNDLSLNIYIKDRAGNQSNTITTSSITLLCE